MSLIKNINQDDISAKFLIIKEWLRRHTNAEEVGYEIREDWSITIAQPFGTYTNFSINCVKEFPDYIKFGPILTGVLFERCEFDEIKNNIFSYIDGMVALNWCSVKNLEWLPIVRYLRIYRCDYLERISVRHVIKSLDITTLYNPRFIDVIESLSVSGNVAIHFLEDRYDGIITENVEMIHKLKEKFPNLGRVHISTRGFSWGEPRSIN